MNRRRACAAIIENDSILLVKEVFPDKVMWGLPGGGLEEGESFEEAVIREVKEEVTLDVEVERLLYTGTYALGEERCYLVTKATEQRAVLGFDPEEDKLHYLADLRWFPLSSQKEHVQVAKVLSALKLDVI
ncbi:NUDIX domain-containing protein [Bacillus weihaiensis]|uniref:Nudix hydrolase domain-containing protein n=1 Tax=Bacillus weihaiensis TaxID=1547283 RepID=A0A1L3MRF0_9BACI|nr:NUDIX domain-containing protein [Bacillus weihaiensis]APH04892.1 hypothetical protein A9C19_09095 [Bacillus weihaiensis]